MRIRVVAPYQVNVDGVRHRDGDVVDAPEPTATRAIYHGWAEPAEDDEGEPEEDEDEFVCDMCGFEAASAGGLGSHKRSHE